MLHFDAVLFVAQAPAAEHEGVVVPGHATSLLVGRRRPATRQDVLVQLLAGGAGLDTQLAVQGSTQLLVSPQCLVALARLGLKSHERHTRLFVARVACHHTPKRFYRRTRLTACLLDLCELE